MPDQLFITFMNLELVDLIHSFCFIRIESWKHVLKHLTDFSYRCFCLVTRNPLSFTLSCFLSCISRELKPTSLFPKLEATGKEQGLK